MKFFKFILLTATLLFFIAGYAYKVYYYIDYKVSLQGFGLSALSSGKANIKLNLTLNNRNFFAIKLHDFELFVYDKNKNLLAKTKKQDIDVKGRAENKYTFDISIMTNNEFLNIASKTLTGQPTLIKYKPSFRLWGIIPIWFTSGYKLTKDDLG